MQSKRATLFRSWFIVLPATLVGTSACSSAEAPLADTSLALTAGSVSTTGPSCGSSPTKAISLFQIFDYGMTGAAATAAAAHDDFVWGSGIGNKGATAAHWQAGNASLVNALYMVQGTDHHAISEHDITWWKANHPEWVVYDCDALNRPTRTVAYQPGLPADVPLDISNPEVVAYQVKTAGAFAIARGNNALAVDQTLFFDYDGNQSKGWFGCGTYDVHGSFVRRWGAAKGGFPNYDPKWTTDVANWVETAKHLLATDAMFAAHPLKLIVNHPAGDIADAEEQQVLANVDAVLDETGFADYGFYTQSPSLVHTALTYMEYAQAHGVSILEVAKFSGSLQGDYGPGTVTAKELSWAIGTYLLGNEGRASLFVTPGAYGVEEYYPQYATVDQKLGAACGPYAVASNGRVYSRRFKGGYVVVNTGGAGTIAVSLPEHAYTDLVARPVSDPLPVASADAYVLFTSADGCN